MLELLAYLSELVFFAAFVSTGGSFPEPLSREEERVALIALRQGDADARERLIKHNLRLVAHIAKKYMNANLDQEDLISIGTIGLIKGISTFDPDKGANLATYAARCIQNAILSRRLFFGGFFWGLRAPNPRQRGPAPFGIPFCKLPKSTCPCFRLHVLLFPSSAYTSEPAQNVAICRRGSGRQREKESFLRSFFSKKRVPHTFLWACAPRSRGLLESILAVC